MAKKKNFTFKMEIDTNNEIVTNAYFSKQINKETELRVPFPEQFIPHCESPLRKKDDDWFLKLPPQSDADGLMIHDVFIDEAKNMPRDDNFISYLKEAFPTPNDFYRQICNVPDLNYSKMHDLVVTQAADANKKRSAQIREKLIECGFTFETESDGEMFNFLSTRCKIEYYEATKLMVLYADGRFICQWYDTFDIQTEFDPQNPLTIKSTITYGNPPKS